MKLGEPTKVPAAQCTNCHKLLDGATSVGDSAYPSPSDMSVCIYCGHLMIYTNDLTLRNPTDKEIVDIAGDERIVAINTIREDVK